jgi:hypothetical protein
MVTCASSGEVRITDVAIFTVACVASSTPSSACPVLGVGWLCAMVNDLPVQRLAYRSRERVSSEVEDDEHGRILCSVQLLLFCFSLIISERKRDP